MFKLKTIPKESVPNTLSKAQEYRQLGEPLESESLCLDILAIEPDNQEALVTIILAEADQFLYELSPNFTNAIIYLKRLKDPSKKTYYTGVIYEQRAHVHMQSRIPGSGQLAYEWYQKAMSFYEKSMERLSLHSEDALLRWNTCARIIMRDPSVVPICVDYNEHMLE